MTQAATAEIWLSQSAFTQLTAELEEMSGPRRAQIVAEISAARDEGDLKENGGYHAAREALGRLEGEIEHLKAVLERAHTNPPADDGIVAPGKLVTYKFEGDDDDEAETWLFASIEMKEFTDHDVFSAASPIGAAVEGAKAGETVAFEGPRGTLKVQILEVVPFRD